MIKWSARLSIIGAQWSFTYLFSTQRLHYLSFQPWHLFWKWLLISRLPCYVFCICLFTSIDIRNRNQLSWAINLCLIWRKYCHYSCLVFCWCLLVFARWYWTWKYCQVWWLVFWLFWLIMIGDENGVSMSKWHRCVQSCESMSNLEQLMWHSGIEVLVKI